MDLQLLVVTTSEGTVWAFSFATLDLRWTQTIPAGPAGIAPKRPEQATAHLEDGLVAPVIRNQEVTPKPSCSE